MNRLTVLARRYPIASVAVLLVVLYGLYSLLTARPQPRAAAVPTPTPTPVAQVTPAPPPPVAATPVPAPAVSPPPPQAAGRTDPFQPLVQARAGPAPGPRPVSLPPPAPLPPPLFPGPGVAPSPVAPAPPARLSTGAQLIGVLGDTGRVAIIRVGGQVFIVAQGEMIQDKVRVELVDAAAGLVVLVEDGQRFEVRFG